MLKGKVVGLARENTKRKDLPHYASTMRLKVLKIAIYGCYAANTCENNKQLHGLKIISSNWCLILWFNLCVFVCIVVHR